MVVGRDYMLKKTTGPSAPKLFLDTQVVPLAVNVAGGVEVALEGLSRRTGIRPSVILAGLAGLVTVAALFGFRQPRRRVLSPS